ncbi:MAG: protease, partial [Methylobacterium sp.]|nr:protease [Methylobacterium sp.]
MSVINGTVYDDILDGTDDEDTIDGGSGGTDTINGKGGRDTVSYASSQRGTIIDLNAQLTWDGENNDRLSSIENALGSSFNDTLNGSNGNNVLDGGAGGADQIDGNGGIDTVSYASSRRGAIIDLNAQLTWDGENNDRLSSIENAL